MEPHRSTVRDLRRRNRAGVLEQLFFDGPRSRQELSKRTGLSTATSEIRSSANSWNASRR